jgi:hypothetical protein
MPAGSARRFQCNERVVDVRRAAEAHGRGGGDAIAPGADGAIREWNRELIERSGSDREGRGRDPGVEPGVDRAVGT